jgi:hypothetical protein
MAASALAAGVLYGNIGNRQPVLAVARPVAAGDVIQSADLTEVLIATDPGTSVIDASAREGIVGHIAAVPLVPGSLLARGQVTNDTTSISGRAVVGATLKPGQFPIELQRGDSVIALVLPPDSAQRSAADGGGEPVPATVVGLTDVPDAPGTIAVSLAIAPDRANFVAAGGARGLIVLVLTPR